MAGPRWLYVAESDAGTYVVRDHVDRDAEQIVTWSIQEARWVCTCGEYTIGLSRCRHVETVGRSLPLDVALRLGSAAVTAKGAANKKREWPV